MTAAPNPLPFTPTQERMRFCSVDHCVGKVKSRGLCGKHLMRLYRHGDVHARTSASVAPGTCPVRSYGQVCGRPLHAEGRCFEHYWAARWPLPVPDVPDEPACDWQERAVCRDADDPDDWFPDGQGARPPARVIAACASCPVRGDCLAAALGTAASWDLHGVWGGLPPRTRARLRVEQGRAA